MLVWREVDTRPVSEYLYHYHMWRKDCRYLYYCKECIKNFDTKERVQKCQKCGGESIVELPKEPPFMQRRTVRDSLSAAAGKLRQRLAAAKDAFGGEEKPAKGLLLKMRVAFHYYTVGVPKGELK